MGKMMTKAHLTVEDWEPGLEVIVHIPYREFEGVPREAERYRAICIGSKPELNAAWTLREVEQGAHVAIRHAPPAWIYKPARRDKVLAYLTDKARTAEQESSASSESPAPRQNIRRRGSLRPPARKTRANR